MNLYFERFLNPKRQGPPDFDVGFSWDERDEMYDYIFHRYQTGNAALMDSMSTFRSRGILREQGNVYGLPKGEIDLLVNEPENMLNKNEVTNMVLSVYNRMADIPNQRTIHASGVLISELPLTNYSALDFPPKGLPTMQFYNYTAEEIGFEKFDILSHRGIGHIKECKKIGTSSVDLYKLSADEQMKIKCGKAHFNEFDHLEYRVVNKVGQLMN